jgi:hypothetical protein
MPVSGIFQSQANRNRGQARSYSFAAGANLAVWARTTVGAGLLANKAGQQLKMRMTQRVQNALDQATPSRWPNAFVRKPYQVARINVCINSASVDRVLELA